MRNCGPKWSSVVQSGPDWSRVVHCCPMLSIFGQSGPNQLKLLNPLVYLAVFSRRVKVKQRELWSDVDQFWPNWSTPHLTYGSHPKMYISNILLRSLSVEHKPSKNEGHQWEIVDQYGPVWSRVVQSGPKWFIMVQCCPFLAKVVQTN